MNTVRIKLHLYDKIDDRYAMTTKESILEYIKIKKWLENHDVVYNFEWIDTGRFCPDYIVMDEYFATVFKLTFDVRNKATNNSR